MYGAVGLSWQQRGPPGPLLRVYRVRVQNFGVGVLWWLQVPYIHGSTCSSCAPQPDPKALNHKILNL